ncbi:MAG: hypothetical protein Q8K60_07005 [Parachlamydiaceae bacterium]|nr:hypothetical protein [Parachlamydiaceae bacterium]
MMHVSNTISPYWNAFWKNNTLINVTEKIDSVCDFFQAIQLFSLLGHSGINVSNELKHKNFLPVLNNTLGKSQLIDALGIFQLLGNIRRFDKNQSAIASMSEIFSMAADVLYFPAALQELNLICLEKYARQLGKLPLLQWVPNQSIDRWVNSCLFYKYLYQTASNVEKYIILIKKGDFNEKKRNKLKVALLSGIVGFAEATYYASTLFACKQKTIDRLMFIAKFTGVISTFFMPKTN